MTAKLPIPEKSVVNSAPLPSASSRVDALMSSTVTWSRCAVAASSCSVTASVSSAPVKMSPVLDMATSARGGRAFAATVRVVHVEDGAGCDVSRVPASCSGSGDDVRDEEVGFHAVGVDGDGVTDLDSQRYGGMIEEDDLARSWTWARVGEAGRFWVAAELASKVEVHLGEPQTGLRQRVVAGGREHRWH